MGGLTGTTEGPKALRTVKTIQTTLVTLISDKADVIATDSMLALINLSSDPSCVDTLLENLELVPKLIELISDNESKFADKSTQILSNLTRELSCCSKVFEQMKKSGIGIDKLINLLC